MRDQIQSHKRHDDCGSIAAFLLMEVDVARIYNDGESRT